MKIKGTLKAVQREAKDFKGKMQRGICIADKWYDVCFSDDSIDYNALFSSVYVRGYIIEIELAADNKTVISGKVIEKLDPVFKGKKKKDMINYHEMLVMFIKRFKSYSMSVKEVKILQDVKMIDMYKKEVTVTMAVVTTAIEASDDKGHIVHAEATGDASSANCNSDIAQHFVRMAETRSYARALRSILGEDVVAEEC